MTEKWSEEELNPTPINILADEIVTEFEKDPNYEIKTVEYYLTLVRLNLSALEEAVRVLKALKTC